jgi:hypothetical protein
MSMQLDLIWDDDVIQYRAGCADCSYRSAPVDDEEAAVAAWFGHVCVRVGSRRGS